MANDKKNIGVIVFIIIIIMLLITRFIDSIKEHTWLSVFIIGLLIIMTIFIILAIISSNRKVKIFGKIKDEKIKNLIKDIEQTKLQDIRDEEDFEKQLFQRLDAKNYKVDRQVSLGSTRKIDLLINGKIGIELKIADRGKNVQDLVGQITIYNKYLRKIIVVILYEFKVPEMNEYIEMIRNVDKEKIIVVLIKGNIKRLSNKEEYILIKKD